jgi:hypothetical protein
MIARITHISDTHGIHNKLSFTGGDILIHTGDIFDYNMTLTEEEILNWFDNLPYKYKIIVQGNHDYFTGNNMPNNTWILNNQIINLHGIKIYGSSSVLSEQNSFKKFNTGTEIEIKNGLQKLPVDILCTHGSPKGIMDIKFGKSIGSISLLSYVNEIKPKFHLFGHTHHSIGIKSNQDTTFINNSMIRFIKHMNIQSKPINIDY